METRHPLEGPLGSEFPAICNHCGVMTAWSCKTWKFCEQFLRFFGNTTPYGKIFEILFRRFSPPHQWTLLWFKRRKKFVPREIGEIVRYLPDKEKQNFGCLSYCRYCANRAQNLTRPAPIRGSRCSEFHPNRFTFGGVIAERVMAVLLAYRIFAWFASNTFEATSNNLIYRTIPAARNLRFCYRYVTGN